MNRVKLIMVLAAAAWAFFIPGAAVQAADQPAAGVVNINTASVEELVLLPGVGEKVAQEVIDHRTKTGGFKAPEEIKMVKGIGDKTWEKIKGMVVIEGETTMKPPEKKPKAPKKKTSSQKKK